MGDVFDVLEDGVQEAEVILFVVDNECPDIGGLRPLEVVQAHELVFVLGARFLNLLGQPGGDVHATFESQLMYFTPKLIFVTNLEKA